MAKVYRSFSEIPFHEPIRPSYNQKLRFSNTELQHIFIALFVLTIAFAFALAPNPPLSHIEEVFANLPLSFLAIVTAFFCHEIAHKYMGQRYGYWSEFRMFPLGLLIALFLGIVAGFIFAAPGAVQIQGRPTLREIGKISVAGPFTNIILALSFAVIYFVSTGLLAQIAFFVGYINAFLGIFNLLPFGPLDGLKIFTWRKEVWVGLLATGITALIILTVA